MKEKRITAKNTRVYSLRNNLPWNRKERIIIDLPDGWEGSTIKSSATLSDVVQDRRRICFLANIPAMSSTAVWLRRSIEPVESSFRLLRMENRYLRVTLSYHHMIREILYKPTGTVILSDADNLLTPASDCSRRQGKPAALGETPCLAGPYRWEIRQFGEMQTGIIT